MELSPQYQNYEWGKIGLSSKVAQLLKSANEDMNINLTLPYAELWMGTHPSGPSKLTTENILLSEWLSAEKPNGQLPYLFKVLSIQKALSIQAHPNKRHAEDLHSSRPDLYKDPNHKPELAIALTLFTVMCGFRPYENIQEFFKEIPTLRDVVGNENIDLFIHEPSKATLKKCFNGLMTSEPDVVKQAINNTIQLFSTSSFDTMKMQSNLFLSLVDQFPGDVGVFCIYFLNLMTLKPGEAIYLGPNIPHAYISGDCIECMASSDNVVRAGLTPKFKDVQTLIEMLDYTGSSSENQLFKPLIEDEYTELFNPPVPDFAVAKIEIPANITLENHSVVRSTDSIILVISGNADTSNGSATLSSGRIIFLPAQERFTFTKVCGEKLIMYQAMSMQ